MLLKNKVFVSKVLIVLLSVTYFIPNFYSVDRIGNQWLYMGFINLIGIIFSVTVGFNLKYFFNSKALKYLFGFLIWCSLSLFYAFNKVETIITLNQYFTVFISLVLIHYLLKEIPGNKKFIFTLIFSLLVLEIFLSGYPILKDIESGSVSFRSMSYSGAAANINITAFSLLYKLPFVLYFLSITRKNITKFILAFINFIILVIIGVLGTRGAYIGILTIYFIFLIFLFFDKNKFKTKLYNLSLLGISITLSLILNYKILDNQNNFFNRGSTINISTNDGSVNQRLRYYTHSFNHIKENFILGTGLGNWKIESINYDKNDINGYIIPYHAHNDFLQIFSETGIIGFLLYGLFLFHAFKALYFKKENFENNLNIILFSSLVVYGIDSMLNFPIARPISQIFLIFLISVVSIYTTNKNEV